MLIPLLGENDVNRFSLFNAISCQVERRGRLPAIRYAR